MFEYTSTAVYLSVCDWLSYQRTSRSLLSLQCCQRLWIWLFFFIYLGVGVRMVKSVSSFKLFSTSWHWLPYTPSQDFMTWCDHRWLTRSRNVRFHLRYHSLFRVRLVLSLESHWADEIREIGQVWAHTRTLVVFPVSPANRRGNIFNVRVYSHWCLFLDWLSWHRMLRFLFYCQLC